MKLNNKIKEVNTFNISENFTYTSKNFLFEKNEKLEIRKDNKYSVISNFHGFLFIFSDGKIFKRGELKFDSFEFYFLKILSGNYLVIYEFDFELCKSKYNIFDLSNKKLVIEWTFHEIIYINNTFFNYSNISIEMFNNINTSYWQHPFSFPPYLDGFEAEKPTQVEQFIGIYKNELWVLFSNNRFLVLDIATGEELYQIKNLKDNLQLEVLATGDVFLDEENKKIKILAYLYYIEIDLDTRKAEIKKTYTDGFVIGKGQFYEGDKYVYFNGSKDISAKKSIGNNITGIFNTETTEIEWYYKIDEDEKFAFFVDKPQANKKYFGVRDSNDTLHLFDRK